MKGLLIEIRRWNGNEINLK